MKKFYIAIDKEDIIWGIGRSPEKAIIDAKNSLFWRRPKLKTLECTKEIYKDVYANGYCHLDGEPYWFYDKDRKIAFYPKPAKRQNVFKTLP